MATKMSQVFRKFRTRLEITGLQETTVSTGQTEVRGVMDAGLTVNDSF